MTEPSYTPSEQEVQAAVKAIEQGVCEACGRPAIGGITPQDCERSDCVWAPGSTEQRARAALTAAAQVRERADTDNPGFGYIVNCAKPDCDGVHGVAKLVDAPHSVKARDCSCHMAVIALADRKGEG